MIRFFSNGNEANDFMERHQELRPVSVSADHSIGSVVVLFEAKPPAELNPPKRRAASKVRHASRDAANKVLARPVKPSIA